MLRSKLLFILFSLCLLVTNAHAQGPSITVVGDHSPPFRIFGKHHASGIYFDTIKEIGKRMNFTPRFVKVPFKRALDMMRQNNADMMPGPNYSDLRAQYMVFTPAMFPAEPKAFYFLNPMNEITRLADLQGKKVATTLGKSYNDILKGMKDITIEVVKTHELAVPKVLNGRNDVVILPEFQGDYLMRTQRLKLRKSPFKLAGNRSHICLSQQSPLIYRQKELQETMEAINDDGTFQMIIDQYVQ